MPERLSQLSFGRLLDALGSESPTFIETIALLTGCPEKQLNLLETPQELKRLQTAINGLMMSMVALTSKRNTFPRTIFLDMAHPQKRIKVRIRKQPLSVEEAQQINEVIKTDLDIYQSIFGYDDEDLKQIELSAKSSTHIVALLLYSYLKYKHSALTLEEVQQAVYHLPANAGLLIASHLTASYPVQTYTPSGRWIMIKRVFSKIS